MPMTPGELITAADVEPYPYRRTIEREDGSARTLILIAPRPADESESAKWAIVQHHVVGWRCTATGGFVAGTPEEMTGVLEREYGDGVDRLPRDQFGVTRHEGEMIHTRRPGGVDTYCGTRAPNPYVHIRRPGRCEQHCLKCRTHYSAEHYGRLAMMER
jgi:hypothetical protein